MVLGTKPNPYKAVAKFKQLLTETADDIIAISISNFGKKNCKRELQIRRQKQMDKIETSEISLETYLHSIGTLAFHYDKRIIRQRPLDKSTIDNKDCLF